MSIENNTTIVWRINSFDLISFNAESNVKSANQYIADQINFNLSVDFTIQPKEHLVIVTLVVGIYANAKQDELLGSIQTKAHFEILNYDDITSGTNGLPKIIAANLIGIAVSTTRGMLLLMSKGTVFEKAIIPIIDPSVFLASNPAVHS